MAKEHGDPTFAAYGCREPDSALLAAGIRSIKSSVRPSRHWSSCSPFRILPRQDFLAARACPDATRKDHDVRLARRRSIRRSAVRGARDRSTRPRLPGMLLLDPKAPGALLRRRLRVSGRRRRQGGEHGTRHPRACRSFRWRRPTITSMPRSAHAALCEPMAPDPYTQASRST